MSGMSRLPPRVGYFNVFRSGAEWREGQASNLSVENVELSLRQRVLVGRRRRLNECNRSGRDRAVSSDVRERTGASAADETCKVGSTKNRLRHESLMLARRIKPHDVPSLLLANTEAW